MSFVPARYACVAILDHMPAAISLKDLEGRYVLVNRGWEDLFGVKNDEIVGHTNLRLDLQDTLQSDVQGTLRISSSELIAK